MIRGGPPRPLAGFLPLSPADVLAEAHRLHGAPAPYDPSSSSPPPAREPGEDDGDVEPEFTNFETSQPAPSERPDHTERNSPAPEPASSLPGESGRSPSSAPTHAPRFCKSCSAPILWAALLDEAGQRIRRDDDKGWKSIPVNFYPDPVKGNVVLFHREGEGIVCRVLKKGERPPSGARLRTSHFADCPNASRHRRKR